MSRVERRASSVERLASRVWRRALHVGHSRLFRALACGLLLAGLARPARAEGQQKPQSPATPVTPQGKPQAGKPQPAKPKPAKPKPAPLTAAQLAKRAPGRPGSFEVMGGAAWLGSTSLGSSPANLTANGSAAPYRYFVATGDMASAPGFDARVTYNLTRRFAIEGGLTYSAPAVRVAISSDTEAGGATTGPSETLTQYFFDATVLAFLPKLSFSKGRGRVFVEGGAGYLRQLHEGRFSVESGEVYNVGAGVKQFFKPRPRGFIKGFGWRADVRGYFKHNGYSFDKAGAWTVGGAGAAVVAF